MKLRAATPLDREAIAAVQAESWRTTYREMLPDAYLDDKVEAELIRHWANVEILPKDVVLVAEDDQIVGFIAIWCDPDPFIDNLHILPNRQSKGTGRKLMYAAAEELQRLGYTTAYLWVLENNLRAIRFYESLGGVRTKLENKNIFGHIVPNLKIEWQDVSTIGSKAIL